MALRSTGLRFQQVIPNVGAGKIKVASNPFEDLGAQHEIVANQIVPGLDLLQGLDPIRTGERHEKQQSAEPPD
jgi:hypothetical protein